MIDTRLPIDELPRAVQPIPSPEVLFEEARRRRRRRWFAGGVVATAALAGAALAYAGSGGGGTSGGGHINGGHGAAAYASYSGMSTPTRAALTDAIIRCDREADRYSTDRVGQHGAGPIDPFRGELALSAVGGKYAGLISVTHSVMNTCTTPERPGRYGNGMQGQEPALAVPAPDQVSDEGLSSTGNALGEHETLIVGRAGRDVSAVTFVFHDGRAVGAKVEHGWYMAWWPGLGSPTSIRVRNSSGRVKTLPGP